MTRRIRSTVLNLLLLLGLQAGALHASGIDFVGDFATTRGILPARAKLTESTQANMVPLSILRLDRREGLGEVSLNSLDEPCDLSHYSGPPQYLDTTIAQVFQYFDVPSGLTLPATPLSLSVPLYFQGNGLATDSMRLIVSTSCPEFGEICCTPRIGDCAGALDVVRGTSFPTLLDLTIDISGIDCCYHSGFWVTVLIDSVYSGERPSFLFSSSFGDPDAPEPCEQWLTLGGATVTTAPGDLGWAALGLNVDCGVCASTDSIGCENLNPETDLNCGSYVQVACNPDPVVLTNQSNSTGNFNVSSYCCAPWDESGPEKLYRIDVPDAGNLTVTLSNTPDGDLDLFLLDSCSAGNCIMAGDEQFSALDLPAGIYYIVVDGFDGSISNFDLEIACVSDCAAESCSEEIEFGRPAGNLYLDGEWDRNFVNAYFSYYPGTGTTQQILGGAPNACDWQPQVTWTSQDAAANRMLALDPRSDGRFWCGTITDYANGTGKLYLVNMSGAVVQSWSAIANLPTMRWSGAAFDSDNSHLWVFIRDSSDAGNSRAWELDVSNMASPLVIQGPHPLPQLSPYTSLSSGGSDYSEEKDIISVVHQGYPVDFVECYLDLDPSYAGPPPGPGLATESWCSPDSNAVQGFGIAAWDEGGDQGKLLMMNFTDTDYFHALHSYDAPTRLRPPDCPRVTNLTVYRTTTAVQVRWQPSSMGIFMIYSSLNPDNDGNPDAGADPDFTLETTVVASGSASWNDFDAPEDFKSYVVLRFCP